VIKVPFVRRNEDMAAPSDGGQSKPPPEKEIFTNIL
jgi:hypothetical protein